MLARRRNAEVCLAPDNQVLSVVAPISLRCAAMSKLTPCGACASFLPPAASVCPTCGHSAKRVSRLPKAVRGLLAVGGGGLLSVTLSACYGAPCAGSSCGTTCDPYAADPLGDGIDQNCDGVDGYADAGTGDGGAVTDGGSNTGDDAGASADGGATDAGATDAGASDAGSADDGGTTDDAGASDAGAAADAAAP